MDGGAPPDEFPWESPEEGLSANPFPSTTSKPLDELPELSAFVTKIPFDPFEFVVILTLEMSKLPFVFTKTAELIP